jgi:transcription antitermination factor NusG
MPDHEIERLKSMIDEHGFVRLPNKPPPAPARVFKKGDKVKIIGGPLEGVRTIHSGMRAGDRERCLLSILGSSSRPVMIPAHQVQAL